ncbi:hypothetical protein SCLCIDRAFT_33678 [Scleroderma citrinum Foug A]|uniref:Uncharacterized protein n=1 Tax=Scleroderma citrinum Foug A TaxID=1036808 RepID=A0A0C3D510_9AGAM|nr:hypothetical protein SCLCIDRAFT_33678 [Scleroderma citrinum Foug A]
MNAPLQMHHHKRNRNWPKELHPTKYGRVCPTRNAYSMQFHILLLLRTALTTVQISTYCPNTSFNNPPLLCTIFLRQRPSNIFCINTEKATANTKPRLHGENSDDGTSTSTQANTNTNTYTIATATTAQVPILPPAPVQWQQYQCQRQRIAMRSTQASPPVQQRHQHQDRHGINGGDGASPSNCTCMALIAPAPPQHLRDSNNNSTDVNADNTNASTPIHPCTVTMMVTNDKNGINAITCTTKQAPAPTKQQQQQRHRHHSPWINGNADSKMITPSNNTRTPQGHNDV